MVFFFNIYSIKKLFFFGMKEISFMSFHVSCIQTYFESLKLLPACLHTFFPPKYIKVNYLSEAFQRGRGAMSYAVHYIQLTFYTSSPTDRFQTLLNVPRFMALLISLVKIYPHKKEAGFPLKRSCSPFISQFK